MKVTCENRQQASPASVWIPDPGWRMHVHAIAPHAIMGMSCADRWDSASWNPSGERASLRVSEYVGFGELHMHNAARYDGAWLGHGWLMPRSQRTACVAHTGDTVHARRVASASSAAQGLFGSGRACLCERNSPRSEVPRSGATSTPDVPSTSGGSDDRADVAVEGAAVAGAPHEAQSAAPTQGRPPEVRLRAGETIGLQDAAAHIVDSIVLRFQHRVPLQRLLRPLQQLAAQLEGAGSRCHAAARSHGRAGGDGCGAVTIDDGATGEVAPDTLRAQRSQRVIHQVLGALRKSLQATAATISRQVRRDPGTLVWHVSQRVMRAHCRGFAVLCCTHVPARRPDGVVAGSTCQCDALRVENVP